MVKKTIGELDDILSTQLSSAVVAIEQNGATFKATVRPNPPRQINVTSQAQLESELGINLEISDNTGVTIFVDESFSLSKPFKIGDNSALRIQSGVIRTTITYTGTGAMFQNTNPANLIGSLIIQDIVFAGNSNSSFVDIRGILPPTAVSLFLISELSINSFNSLGYASMAINDIAKLLPTNITIGIFFENPLAVIMSQCAITQLDTHDMTFVSISTFFPATINLNIFNGFDFDNMDTMFYLAPTIPLAANISVTNAILVDGDLYQKGILTGSTANAMGADANDTQFDITTHDLKVGQVIQLVDFTTQTGYNGIHRVTVVNGPNSVDIDVAFLGVDATGNVTAASLDSTDVQVSAERNPGQADSMFTSDAGLELFGSELTVIISSQNIPEVITSASWAFSNLERFSIGVANEGQLISNEPSAKRFSISFSGTIEKGGGGSLNVGIVVLKNGVNVSFNPPHTVNTGKIQISGSDIIELEKDDIIQVAVINYADVANIDVSQISLVVNKA